MTTNRIRLAHFLNDLSTMIIADAMTDSMIEDFQEDALAFDDPATRDALLALMTAISND